MDQYNKPMHLKKVCRTCLLLNDTMLSIFSAIEVPNLELLKLPILDLLKIFTNISVSPDDGLPENICCDCLYKVYQSYTFKLKCKQSEVISKQLKDDKENMNELTNPPNEYEHYTESSIARIKKEKVEYCDPSNTEQDRLLETFEQEVPFVQELQQEGVDFNRTDSYEEHSKNHIQCWMKPNKCEICIQNCRRKYNMKSRTTMEDVDEVVNNDKFKCATCSKLFGRKSHLNRHMKIHSAKKPFQCEICLNKFRFKMNLVDHMQTAHSNRKTTNRKSKCVKCAKLFGSKSDMKLHMKDHIQENRCELCQRKFRSKSTLIDHMQSVHVKGTIKNSNLKCTVCSKLFGYKSHLNRHMKIHSTEKLFQCAICQKNFRFKNNLKDHMQAVHVDGTTNSIQFKCAICSKLCISNYYLNRHMKIHTAERPFQCYVCTKHFRYKNSLKVHMQTAHVDVDKRDLKRHMRIYTDEIPFQCEVCPNKFRFKNNLNDHMVSVHNDGTM